MTFANQSVGGSGTAGSHLEKRNYHNSFMTVRRLPVHESEFLFGLRGERCGLYWQGTLGDDAKFDRVAMAVFEDSGSVLSCHSLCRP